MRVHDDPPMAHFSMSLGSVASPWLEDRNQSDSRKSPEFG